MKSLTIGLVLDDTLDSTDGVQQYIITLGTWLAAQGHQVHYIVGQTDRTDMPNIHSLSRNMKVRFNGNRMSMPLPMSDKMVKQLLDTIHFDILHVQMPYSPFMAQRIIANAAKTTAVIGTFHIAPNSSLVTLANRALGIGTRKSVKRFNRILSVSSAAKQFARMAYGIDTTIIPNAVETKLFKNSLAAPLNPDVVNIVFLGRLVERKGCRIVIDALKILKDNGSPLPLHLTICGRGPLQTELQTHVATLGMTDTVHFKGYVTDEVKAQHLKAADIAVFPSSGGESFGIVLVEAMAAEHPVVLGANNPGYASVLGEYPDVLFPINNAEALANKIQIFAFDQSERHKALNWQINHVKQFDIEKVGHDIEQIYNEALHQITNVQ